MDMLQLVIVVLADSRGVFVSEGFEKHDLQASWRRRGSSLHPNQSLLTANATSKS